MKLNDVINIAQRTRWTKINNFFVNILVPDEKFSKKAQWNDSSEFQDKLNASLISCTTPQYSNANVESYVSYEWRYHQGRDEAYRFTMTFRDFNQMELYSRFRGLYTRAKEEYFDTFKMNILIWLDEDFDVPRIPIFYTDSAIIESLSSLQFSHNTQNQIAEFTVAFRCNTIQDPAGPSL